MQIESELYSALVAVGVPTEKAERVADALSKSIDQRYMEHAMVIISKAEVEALRAEILKTLIDQTWRLAWMVLGGMVFVLTALKFTG
ncbi:MAG: hypothetical protein ACKVIH_03240 [Burkholderiales bacterium]